MATTFTDATGRTWDVRITLGLLPKLRAAGFDLGRGKDGWDGLSDPETLGRVLWVLVGPQAEAKGVSEEQFADGFDGPALFAATDAIMGAVADFTRRPVVAAATKERLPAVIREQEAEQVKRILNPTPSGSGGNSPPSPGSTEATTPSAN